MPVKTIAIAIFMIISYVATFYAGYSKKGVIEAERTTEAIQEAVKKGAKKQDGLIDIGLDHADKEIEIKVVERIIEKEVIKYVKTFSDSDSCYDVIGVQHINQALGYSKGEDNREYVNGQLP